MRKVVSIHSREFLASYRARKHANAYDLAFFIGVLVAIALPHLAYVDYGGPVPPQVLAATIATGVCGGLLLYRGRRFEDLTLFSKALPQAASADLPRRNAA